jgi:Xaa-Pro dipeptidase
MSSHIERVLSMGEEAGLSALALVPGPNLRYLTGLSFITSERPVVALLSVRGTTAVVLPSLEAGKAVAAGFQPFPYTDEQGYEAAFSEACASLELGGTRLGVEALRMRLLEARILEEAAPSAMLVPVDGILFQFRMVKAPCELAAMRQAVKVAEQAFLTWAGSLHEGMIEREAAAGLVAALLTGGADALAFEPIVASGSQGALPHAVPGDRQFREGDWIVVDWGAKVDGYCSDLTRALVVGKPSGELEAVHEVVVRANLAAREAVAPGIKAKAVDRAARAVIEAAGYGAQFFHRTGHGLGLEEHEPPYLVAGNSLELRPGMTFTIEPGIYLEGIGGVRIEDDVVVTADGLESLTTLSRRPLSIHV